MHALVVLGEPVLELSVGHAARGAAPSCRERNVVGRNQVAKLWRLTFASTFASTSSQRFTGTFRGAFRRPGSPPDRSLTNRTMR